MPTPPKKYRTYCKSCKDFTIHNWEEKPLCESCGTENVSYLISEVEPKLIQQQRERYKRSRAKRMNGLYNAFIVGSGINALMELDELVVVECDAGQKEIDEAVKQRKLAYIEEQKAIEKDFKDNYSHLGRNELCSCGSGKKFKKCHLLIFRNKTR